MTLQESKRLRLLTLCLLYLAQGIPWGFVVFTLSTFLTEQGLSPDETGKLVAISIVPWTFKWLWGPLIDGLGASSMGRRRPWILAAQAGMAGSLLAMLSLDDLAASLGLLMTFVFVHNVFNSLQDVSVDALAVDLLSEQERGVANGLMFGSKYLGGAIGGAGLANLVAPLGMDTALTVQGIVLSLIFLFPLLLLERPGDRFWPGGPARVRTGSLASRLGAAAQRSKEVFRWLLRAFQVRSSWVGVLLVLGMGFSAAILDKITEAYFIQEAGWSAEQWASLAGGWAVGLGLVGSIGGGWLADRAGAKRVIALASVGLAASWLVFASQPELWDSRSFIVVLVLLGTVLQSIASVAMFSLAMGLSWPKVAATQFTAYMALSNLSSTLGYRWSGAFDRLLDLREAHALSAAILCASLLLLQAIDPQQARRELGSSG